MYNKKPNRYLKSVYDAVAVNNSTKTPLALQAAAATTIPPQHQQHIETLLPYESCSEFRNDLHLIRNQRMFESEFMSSYRQLINLLSDLDKCRKYLEERIVRKIGTHLGVASTSQALQDIKVKFNFVHS